MAPALIEKKELLGWRHGKISRSLTLCRKPWFSSQVRTDLLRGGIETPKTQTAILAVVVALEDTTTSSSEIQKTVDTKDIRIANDDAVNATLGVKPSDVSPLTITGDNSSTVRVLLDQCLVHVPKVAIHPSGSNTTSSVFGAGLRCCLRGTGVKLSIHSFNRATLDRPPKAPTESTKAADGRTPDAELIGITTQKEIDFSNWYEQVLTNGDMSEYYDISGCYILKALQHWFNTNTKSIGVDDCYFPMFVSEKLLEREKDHIEGLAQEAAWNELEEHIAIRPTSETVMYPYYAKWICNQWNSVVHRELKHPELFLRTREFLWQEGHTAHISLKNTEEVIQILEWYAGIYSSLLAVPIIRGRKTEKEKFAGGLFTTTCEAYTPSTGRGIQGATPHCPGQNPFKTFNTSAEDPSWKGGDRAAKKPSVWQSSWGLSTGAIGVMARILGDNIGLVLPPRVAQFQVVIVPCGLTANTTEEERKRLLEGIGDIATTLSQAGIRELKGVPVRLEFGPRDMAKKQVLSARRDTGVKSFITIGGLAENVQTLLDTIQKDLYDNAKKAYDAHTIIVKRWADFTAINMLINYNDRRPRGIRGRSDDGAPEDAKAPSMGAKSLCIPFGQPKGDDVARVASTRLESKMAIKEFLATLACNIVRLKLKTGPSFAISHPKSSEIAPRPMYQR
ncbi:hypothetical protein HOY80DRAFT_1009916 [Tuber brumale]|nr:hypothetical protein HOY80DRAFT_1009916 [Tuber brumale]